jgi:bifunctional DNA-binding transcriptional regulator/antitoxin component of YhaV-PrlF toxin-antitoxin module
MRATIDSAGRIVIPREIRVAAGLDSTADVEVDIHEGVISIEAAPTEVKIVRRGKLHVMVPTKAVPPLRQSVVDSVRERVRRRR